MPEAWQRAKKKWKIYTGTIVAIDDSTPGSQAILLKVYLMYVTGIHKITEIKSKAVQSVNMYSKSLGEGRVEPVTAIKGKSIHWILFAPENIKKVMAES